jgi:hypothetical protein
MLLPGAGFLHIAVDCELTASASRRGRDGATGFALKAPLVLILCCASAACIVGCGLKIRCCVWLLHLHGAAT